MYSSILLAQNYKTINPNRALYFTDTMTNIFAIKIDSMDIVNNDTSYYSFKTLRQDSLILSIWDTCAYHVDDSWMGRKVIIKPNGYNIFINENYDSVFVNTQAHLGDTFLLYTYTNNDYIKAIVTSIDTSTILGVLDSVKTYSLITNNSSYSLAPSEIKIGKESGIINMFSFFKFPYGNESLYYQNYPIYFHIPYQGDYLLVGKSNPKVGITKFTNREIYDYNIGDEFNIERIEHDFMSAPPPSLNYKRVLNKYYSASNDTVYYEMERHTAHYSVIQTPSGYQTFTTSELKDTVLNYFTDLDDYVTNAYPEQHRYKDNTRYNNHFTVLNTGFCNGTPYIKEGSLSLYYYPSNSNTPNFLAECFQDAFEPAGISTTSQPGTGIVLKASRGPGSNQGQSWTETTSYQKNGVVCGTIITSIVKANMDSQKFTLYPNPTAIKFNYVFNSRGKNKLQVFDVSGLLVLEKLNLSSQGEIDISELQSGIYFAIISNTNSYSTQKLIIR